MLDRMSKRKAVVVLRSGYEIAARRDQGAVLDHLTNAVMGEAMVVARESDLKSWDDVFDAVDAEIRHLTKTIDDRWVRKLFGLLVRDAVIVKMKAASDELRNESLPPSLQYYPVEIGSAIRLITCDLARFEG